MVLILCSSLGLWGTGTTYDLSAFIPWLCKIRTRAVHNDWGLKGSLMLLYNRSNFNTVRSDREAQNFCNGSCLAKIKDAIASDRNMVWPPWREGLNWKWEQGTRVLWSIVLPLGHSLEYYETLRCTPRLGILNTWKLLPNPSQWLECAFTQRHAIIFFTKAYTSQCC